MSRLILATTLADIRSLWEFHCVYDEFDKIDAIVCLCSYDLRVAHRCAELIRTKRPKITVVTGGYGNWTKDVFNQPEAEIFGAEIIARGISRDELILETRASNIGQNIEFSRNLLEPLSVHCVLFLTKPQTQQRVLATLGVKWPNIGGLISAPLLDLFQQAQNEEQLINLADEMVGDVQRLIEYPDKGFQARIPISDKVMSAYHRLRTQGFDRHCVVQSPD